MAGTKTTGVTPCSSGTESNTRPIPAADWISPLSSSNLVMSTNLSKNHLPKGSPQQPVVKVPRSAETGAAPAGQGILKEYSGSM